MHLADLTVHGRFHVQSVDLTLEVGDQEFLSIEQRLLAVDVEVVLLGLRVVVHFRLLESELRLLERVLRLEGLQFRVGTEFIGLAAAIAFALRGLLVDLRLIERVPQLHQLLFGVERRALPVDAQTHHRRLFLRQLGGEIRTVDDRQHLPLGHAVAGMHLERHRAQRSWHTRWG